MQFLEFSSTLNLVALNVSFFKILFACSKENIHYKKCSSEKLLVIYIKGLLFYARINFQFKTREQNLKYREGGGSSNGLGMCIFVQVMVGGP